MHGLKLKLSLIERVPIHWFHPGAQSRQDPMVSRQLRSCRYAIFCTLIPPGEAPKRKSAGPAVKFDCMWSNKYLHAQMQQALEHQITVRVS
jgi:hypothetical protein